MTGLGAALFGGSTARAANYIFEGQKMLPGTPIPDGIARAGTDIFTRSHTPSYTMLLERAKAALNTHKGRIIRRDRVALADFGAASHALRFHIVDLEGGRSSSYLVAHGRGSDPGHSGWLCNFSNGIGSLATSDGAYVTGDIYYGQHGQSMRLAGLDPCNNNAAARAIVIHGADYVSEDFLVRWGKLGRSEGCFALARHMVPVVISQLGPGCLLYADKP